MSDGRRCRGVWRRRRAPFAAQFAIVCWIFAVVFLFQESVLADDSVGLDGGAHLRGGAKVRPWWGRGDQEGKELGGVEEAGEQEGNAEGSGGGEGKREGSEESNAADGRKGREGDSFKESNAGSWQSVTLGVDGENSLLPMLLDSEDGRRLLDENGKEAEAGAAKQQSEGEGGTAGVDENPEQYEGELNEQPLEKKEGEDVANMIDHLLDRLEEDDDKGAGRFNETLEKQEAVLEWVARVGKHHHKDLPNEEKEDGENGNEVGSGGKDEKVEEGGENSEGKASPFEVGHVEDDSKKDVAWLGKMLGVGSGDKGKDGKSKNGTSINGHNNTSLRSAGELKELGEAQSRQAKEAKEEAARKEEQQQEERMDELPRLIDSNDNEYVISNPGKGSKMQLQEDLTLISDIVKVIVAAALGALVCGLLGQPLILGYLAAGMIVGPGGFQLIHELVQVETLAQFGVVFLLFALGIEFNLARMQGCQAVALGGGAIQICVAMLLGGLFSTQTTQGIFIGAFLSMSSTAVVIKCLMDLNMTNTEYGQIMLGTLILQDCALGLLLAVMPALAAKGSSVFSIGRSLLWEVALLIAFCGLAWLITKIFIPRFLRTLMRLSKYNSELYQLGCVAICLCVALFSEYLGLSLEVGAFVAGLMLSGGKHSERTLHQMEPIRNIFAALFLASIGMVMHPYFLWHHKHILLSALAVVFFGKACLVAFTVRVFGYSASTAASVGIALAQIGEFSFVLLSRAQALNLVSKKLYLLLMGTTALSLVLTPFAFKLVPYIVANSEKSRLRGRNSNVHLDDSPQADQIMTVMSHRDPEATSMVKRSRGKPHGGSGGGHGGALNLDTPTTEEEFEAMDDERRPPGTPVRVVSTPAWNAALPASSQSGSAPPQPLRASPNSTMAGNSGLGIGVGGNQSSNSQSHFSDLLHEDMREEEKEALPSPVRVMLRRPLGQLPGKWKTSDHQEIGLHHR